MKAAKYLFPLWAGVLLYALLFVVFGPRGVSAQHQLQLELEKQEVNIEQLRQVNEELEDEMNSLLYDRDTLTVHAREQGYALENERFIRIVGFRMSQKNTTSAGIVYAAAEPQYVPTETLIIISFCAGLSIFACMAVFDFLRYLRERH